MRESAKMKTILLVLVLFSVLLISTLLYQRGQTLSILKDVNCVQEKEITRFKDAPPLNTFDDATINPFKTWWKNYRKSEKFGDVFKWNHYFDIYHRHFARFRNKEMTMLEIGVRNGGSLKMWRDYFGPGAQIYGMDIIAKSKRFENELEGVKIIIGDQGNPRFWTEALKTLPKFDIVIDDGGHTMNQLKVTFDHLYDHVKLDGGIYLAEDLHTAYWPNYGGGFKRPETFIEYTKGLIDQLNADHSRDKNLVVTNFTRSTQSIQVYDSIVVFEKSPHPKYHTILSQ
ncbi:unnamed protein product [Owenia fusiformis]|uniref:Uncharacterized protein n=1 Tax=Owenia fusiformis TaxID=6347 RepID=A0A8J1XR85_OWEFU|nr:unnamed protein product [Owenia fusiformis]